MPVVPYATAHVAPPFRTNTLVHPLIGWPPSKNSTVPEGWTGPGRTFGGATVAVYVVLCPTKTVLDTSSDVVLVSGPTLSWLGSLVEPATSEPSAGVKAAVSCADEAGNEVWQTTVAVDPVVETGSFAQPPIAVAPFMKAIDPDGWPADASEATLAISVTPWFVTDELGDTVSVVALVALTGPSGIELDDGVTPPP